MIGELHIKTTMRYYYTPFRKAKIQITDTTNASKDVEQWDFLFIGGGNEKWYSYFGR